LIILRYIKLEIRDRYDEEGFLIIDDSVYPEIFDILMNEDLRKIMIEKNFQIGKREFGFSTLEEKLDGILESYGFEIRASRKRLAKSKMIFSV